ncbi:hypothetical protein JHK85_045193 [Glycine max]|nr:hypothetical protein JHK86_044587 [Glycine max]KAG4951326.1 hypothetical protein JHK85_045193 [Glycine max]
MGLKAIHSSDQVHLIQLLMTENITFPILLSRQKTPKIEKGACYILFKIFRSPVIYHEKDAGLEILSKAVQELQEQPDGDSKSLNLVRCTSLKQDGIIKDECSFSPLQNLLLYYPEKLTGKFPENEPDKSSLCPLSFLFRYYILEHGIQ